MAGKRIPVPFFRAGHLPDHPQGRRFGNPHTRPYDPRSHSHPAMLSEAVSESPQAGRQDSGGGHHPSTQGRFFPSRGATGGIDRRPATIQRRVSAGSITSSTSHRDPAFRALPRSYNSATIPS